MRVEGLLAAGGGASLDDYGGGEFLPGLRVLAADLADPDLPPELAKRLYGVITEHLRRRLKLVAARRADPAIAEEVIQRPVFVVGLPRTGTTALVDLVAQDPAARVVMQWESRHLGELNDKASWENDPRIAAMEEELRAAGQVNPVAALGLHSDGARLPEECNSFLGMTFWSPNLAVLGHLPRYSEWLRFANAPGAYRLHRWVLQHLQHHGRAGRWTLKSPFHVFDMPAVVAEYPDAVFIQTHRDPLQLAASVAGLYATIRGEGPGDPRRAATGREVVRLWGIGMQRCIAARQDPALNARVLDLSHRSVLAGQMAALRTVYDHFGWPLPAEAEARLKAWIAAPAQQQSLVKFSLADFGVDEASVDAAFGDYRARFADLF